MHFRCHNRYQLPPPEIGFKSNIINFGEKTEGIAPYPEEGRFGIPIGSTCQLEKEIGSSTFSTSSLNEYSDYTTESGSTSDLNTPLHSNKPEHIIFPSKINERYSLFSTDTKTQVCEKQSETLPTRRGIPYPTGAFEKVGGRACDHSGGAQVY